MLTLCKCQCPKALGGIMVHGMDALAEVARSMWRGLFFPTGVSWKPRMVISERRTLNWRWCQETCGASASKTATVSHAGKKLAFGVPFGEPSVCS
jgi:hypothetical protein